MTMPTMADEPTLRNVFPDAPEGNMVVPTSVGALFRARMSALGGEQRITVYALVLAVVIVAATAVLTGATTIGFSLLGLVVLVMVGIVFWQYSKASDSFFDTYAAARGLTHEENGAVLAAVPLLGRGDRRKFPRVLTGRIAGQPARLALYTYTEESTDSDGSKTSTDYDFTILSFSLPEQVAARYAGMTLSPKRMSFGALQDKLMNDHKVELESSEFHDRYSLRALDSQDEIALRELFNPPFILLLATEITSYWEQRGSDLVFWRKHHQTAAAELDELCLESQRVLQRYLEEWQ